MNLSAAKSQSERELRELQRLMAAAVMRPLTGRDSMQRKWLDGRPARKIAESFIKPNDRLNSLERLEIYNRQYWFRIRDCFDTDYPGLRAVLGGWKFERLANRYLAQNPSRSFTLRNLGSRLVKFMEANPNLTAPCSQLALNMAQLEWAHIEAFDNEAKPPLQMDALLDANPLDLRLQLQPHLTLLKLDHLIDGFLIQLKRSRGLRNEASHAVEGDHGRAKTESARALRREVNFLAVHRFDGTVYYKRLDAGQFCVLSALQGGSTLESACAQLAELGISGNRAGTVGNWFSNWAALGWFCGLGESR